MDEKSKLTNIPINLENFPSLQKAIDYCALHETTSKESYRKLAVDGFRAYDSFINLYNASIPEIVSEFAPLISKKLGMGGELNEKEAGLAAVINNVLSKLGESADPEGITSWRDHCLGCKKANSGCVNERKKLITFQKRVEDNIREIIKDSVKIGKTIAEDSYSF